MERQTLRGDFSPSFRIRCFLQQDLIPARLELILRVVESFFDVVFGFLGSGRILRRGATASLSFCHDGVLVE